MLKIMLDSETGNDAPTPINIASALIELETGGCADEKTHMAGVDNLEEIADHIIAYVRRQHHKHPMF